MGLQPKIEKRRTFSLKECAHCKGTFGPENFAPTKSLFYPDGTIPICNDCIQHMIDEHGADWSFIDKLCQMMDVPFVPREWTRLSDMNPVNVFPRYCTIFMNSEYEGICWSDYFKAFCELRERGELENELPEVAEKKRADLKQRWGHNYDDEALAYLDKLYRGLLNTQNINGDLQKDQAEKICKISYEIDCRIREGTDFDKLLSSYDKLVKAAEFTPKNVKNINDFETCGELIKWLEKNDWKNDYYNNVPRDIVDETIANIQAFNQRLYTNESGIGEEITRRLEGLAQAQRLEQGGYYTDPEEVADLDRYEVDGYDRLMSDEEFKVDTEDDD